MPKENPRTPIKLGRNSQTGTSTHWPTLVRSWLYDVWVVPRIKSVCLKRGSAVLSFVRRMGRAPEKQSVVNTCISMSKNLDPRSYGVGKQQSRQREMYMSRGSRFKMAGQFHISSSKGTTINAFAFFRCNHFKDTFNSQSRLGRWVLELIQNRRPRRFKFWRWRADLTYLRKHWFWNLWFGEPWIVRVYVRQVYSTSRHSDTRNRLVVVVIYNINVAILSTY